MPPDIGNFRDRQEGGHREQGQQRQQPAVERTGTDQPCPGDDHREAAQPRRHFEQRGLQSQIAEEGQPDTVMVLGAVDQFLAALDGALEGDDLAEALDRIDGMGVQFAQGFARPRAQLVDPLAHEKRA